MYSLILLNGGVGGRVGAASPKQFLEIHGLPMFMYAVRAADPVDEITQIIVNYPPGWRSAVQAVIKAHHVTTPVSYVLAGSTRQESVRRMLPMCTNDRVLIHESARPLVRPSDFRELIADERDNVSYMIPLAFTVAPVAIDSGRVTGYLDRDHMRNAQLPQKFDRAALVAAHEAAFREGALFTEDATMCAVHGAQVFFRDGAPRNFKVTTDIDVLLAGLLLDRELGPADLRRRRATDRQTSGDRSRSAV